MAWYDALFETKAKRQANFFAAVRAGDLNTVITHVSSGKTDLQIYDDIGLNALQICLLAKNTAMARYLVENSKIDVSATTQDMRKTSTLELAIETKDKDLAKLVYNSLKQRCGQQHEKLISALSYVDSYGGSAAATAIAHGNKQLADIITKEIDDTKVKSRGVKGFFDAATKGDEPLIKAYVEHYQLHYSADPDKLHTAFTMEGNMGQTAEMIAKSNGHLQVAKLLHQATIAASLASRNPKYFVIAAAQGNVEDLAHFITAQPHNLEQKYQHNTPLTAALAEGKTDAVILLTKHGANPEAFGMNRDSALQMAVSSQDPALASPLLDALERKHHQDPLYLMRFLATQPLIRDAQNHEVGALIQQIIDAAASRILAENIPVISALSLQNALSLAAASKNTSFLSHILSQLEKSNENNPEKLLGLLLDSGVQREVIAFNHSDSIAVFEQTLKTVKAAAQETRIKRARSEDFLNAITEGNVEEVKAFLTNGKVNPNATTGKNSWNGLLIAADVGNINVIDALLDAGVNPDSRSAPGQNVSALWLTIDRGNDAASAKLLLKLQEHYASNPQKLLAALTHCDATGDSPISLAHAKASSPLKQLFTQVLDVAANAIISSNQPLDARFLNGLSPIQFAASTGHTALIIRETQKLKQQYEETPEELVKALAAKTPHKSTSVEIAELAGGKEAAAYMRSLIQTINAELKRSAEELQEDRNLLEKVKNGNSASVRSILRRGICNVDAQNRKNHATGLYMSASAGSTGKVEAFLEAKANPDARTDKNYSPLNAALLSHYANVAMLLIPALEAHYEQDPVALIMALCNPDQHEKTPLERAQKDEENVCATRIINAIAHATMKTTVGQFELLLDPNKTPYIRLLKEEPVLFEKVLETLSEHPEKMAVLLSADAFFLQDIIENDRTGAAKKIMQSLKGYPDAIKQMLGVVHPQKGTALHYAIKKERFHLLSIFCEGGVIPNTVFQEKTATKYALDSNLIDVFLNFISCGGEVEIAQRESNARYLKHAIVAQVPEAEREEAYAALAATVHKVKFIPKESHEKEFGSYIKLMSMIDAIAEHCDPRHLTRNSDGSYYISPLITSIIRHTSGDWSKMAADLRQAQAKIEEETGADESHVFSIGACQNVKDMMVNIVTLMGLPLLPLTLKNLVDEVQITDEELNKLVEEAVPDISQLLLGGIALRGNHHLNMKGLSLGLILEYSNNWHNNLELLQSNTRETMPEGEWFPLLANGYEMPITQGAMKGGKVVNLHTADMLKKEADAMDNCISTHYTSKGLSGTSHLFSFVNSKGEPRANLEFRIRRRGTVHENQKRISLPGTDKELQLVQFEGPRQEGRRVPNEAKEAFDFLKSQIESGQVPIQLDNIGRSSRPKTIKKGSPLYEAIGSYRPDEEKWEKNFQALLHFTAAQKRTKFLVPSSYRNPDKIDPARHKKPVEAFVEDSGFANALWNRFCVIKPEIASRCAKVDFRGRQSAMQEMLAKMEGMEVPADFLSQLRDRGLGHVANVLAITTKRAETPNTEKTH